MKSKRDQENQPLTFASPTFGTSLERSPKMALPHKEEKIAKPRLRLWLKRAFLSISVLILITATVFGWQFYSTASKLTNEHNPFSLLSSLWPQTPAETSGRVNILLVGYSADDPNHQGAQLTDSIMIVSINPKTKSGSIISIPRDLWVDIPGFGYSKINAAYEYGYSEGFNQAGYFPKGMGLLEKVITQNLGVKFNYFALIDYSAIRDGVNAVGGITINVNSADPRGVYDPYTNIKLPNGNVELNGQMALNLARTRGDGPGSYGIPNADFTRTQYQQKELVALKDKASKLSSIFNPLTVLHLEGAVGSNVVTNLKLGQMESLYKDVKGISNNSIKQVTLNDYKGQNLLENYYDYSSGQDALIPTAGMNDFSNIQAALQQMLYAN